MSWSQLGFSGNPYSTAAISPDELGERLLVGRDAEIGQLLQKLDVSDRVITVEGDNGVGKTSLIRIAAFKGAERYRAKTLDRLFLPVSDVFQLTPTTSVSDLRSKVYYSVARSLIGHKSTLLDFGRVVTGLGALDEWLHRAAYGGTNVSGTAGGFGGGYGKTVEPSTTPGFVDHGFAHLVEEALSEAFPAQSGGLVCILDNLELLQTTASASQAMEELRDTLLSVPGLRWVAAGAQGIVRGAAASYRWNGLLSTPVEVQAVSDGLIGSLIEARVGVYKRIDDPYVPVDEVGFQYLYNIYHRNLREALGACIDYSEWMFETGSRPESSEEKRAALVLYLKHQAEKYLDAVSGVGGAGWRVFDALATTMSGYMTPGDYNEFGYDSYQALNTQTRALVNAQLVKPVAPPAAGDQRRRSYEITPVGWLVHLARGASGSAS